MQFIGATSYCLCLLPYYIRCYVNIFRNGTFLNYDYDELDDYPSWSVMIYEFFGQVIFVLFAGLKPVEDCFACFNRESQRTYSIF